MLHTHTNTPEKGAVWGARKKLLRNYKMDISLTLHHTNSISLSSLLCKLNQMYSVSWLHSFLSSKLAHILEGKGQVQPLDRKKNVLPRLHYPGSCCPLQEEMLMNTVPTQCCCPYQRKTDWAPTPDSTYLCQEQYYLYLSVD